MKGLTMTTVSVQPTAGEQNEREAFREWWNAQIGESVTWTILERFAALSAWQHQQKRIDELECSVQNWTDFSKKWERLCKEKDGEIESLQAKCVLLEKQNTVAVEALEADDKLEGITHIEHVGEFFDEYSK
jgi:hypothetical protein